jgi:hypothetical protein
MRRLAALGALAVTGLATIATSQPAPGLSSTVSVTVHLDAASPVVVERVHLSVDHANNRAYRTSLSVSEGESDPRSAVWASLVADDPNEVTEGRANQFFGSYVERDVTEACASGCERDYWLIVRLQGEGADAVDANLSVRAHASYEGEGSAPPPGARVTVSVDETPIDPSTFASHRAGATGIVRIGQERFGQWRATFEVRGLASLNAPDATVVGRMMLGGEVSGDRHAEIQVSVGDRPGVRVELGEQSLPGTEVDWLSDCVDEDVCILPVTITLFRGSDLDDTSPHAAATLEFELDARLELIGVAQPPAGVSIELVEEIAAPSPSP